MKIRILSDLHEEFAELLGGRLIFDPSDADVTVLAGDIANGLGALEVASREEFANTQVVLVPGNHEFYGAQLFGPPDDKTTMPLVEAMRKQALAHVHVLSEQFVDIKGYRFLGCTLWTDYCLYGVERREQVIELSRPRMADYRYIERVAGSLLTAEDTISIHNQHRLWLAQQIQASPLPVVVVTHHAPHINSVHKRFENNPINPAFVSDCSLLMQGVRTPELWIHGHAHNGFDYRVNKTRVVANPAGYRKRSKLNKFASITDWDYENRKFNPNLVVELGD